MVDGTTNTATTTHTNMLELTVDSNTSTTQATVSNMSGLFHEDHSSTLAPMDFSDDETTYPSLALNTRSNHGASGEDLVVPSSGSAKIRLPSGKTISRKAEGPHTSKHRHRRTPSPDTASHVHVSRMVHGNCAMIANPVTVKSSMPAQKTRHPPTPPTSDSDSESDHSSLISLHQSPNNSMAPRIHLPTHRTTIRSSDAQMLATLPASTQRTLLATSRKAVERAGREEQEYRRKLDGYGNLKSKERFVNDVPGGKSHKNRFMAQ